MSYPIVIGDYHLHNFQQWGRQKVDGINYRAAMSLASLKITLDRHTNTNALPKTFIFAGDVFDTSKPEPSLIAALMDLLGSFDRSQFYLMTGNHDVGSSGPNDHSLAPFKHGPKNIRVVDTPMILPEDPSILMHPWLIAGNLRQSILDKCTPYTKVVIAHGFVQNQPFAISDNTDLTGDFGGIRIISGHQHTRTTLQKKLCIGAFCPVAFGDDSGGIYELLPDMACKLSARDIFFADIEQHRLPALADDIHCADHVVGSTFIRILVDDVSKMALARQQAKELADRGYGGVKIKLLKTEAGSAGGKTAQGHLSLEAAINSEIDKYCAEQKINSHLQKLIQESLTSCLKT